MWTLGRFKGRTGQSSTAPGWTIHFGVYAVMLAVTMPRLLRSFSPTEDPLDTSWAWMLGYALQHRLQWGESVVFTYGPLGFLTHPYFYSDHMLWALSATTRLGSWFIFGLGFAAILRRLVPDGKPFPRTTIPAAIAWVVGARFLHLSSQSAVLSVLLLALALAEEDTAAATVELVLAGFLLALGALIKSTALIVALFTLLVYPALWWYAGRRKTALRFSLLPLLSFLASFCALWLLSSQSLSHLPDYFRGTWAIVSGYTPAMATPPMPFSILNQQLLLALAILALLAAALIGIHLSGRKVRVAQCLLLGGVAFWAWKEGFTLHDPGWFRHPMTFYGTVLLIAGFGTALLSSEYPVYLRTCIYGAYAVGLFSSLMGYPVLSLSYAHVLNNYQDYLVLISSKSRRAAEETNQTTAIQRQFELPDGLLSAVGQASVNVFPWSLMMAQGYHMRLVASPVIQSYSVYTPYLDRMNARQIWEGRGADKIIFSLAALGYRYPPFDDPATFRAMLTCYRTEYPGAAYAVLSHVACAPPQMLAADKPLDEGFGRWIRVPRHASYVGIDMRDTAIGHVTNILYKAKPVWILFGLADGHVAGPFQLIYPVANDGLFIRYFVGSQSDAIRLFSGNAAGLQRIAAIMMVTDPHSLAYAPHFEMQFLHESPLHQYLPGTAAGP